MIIRMRFRAWLCGLLGLPLLFTGCATPTGANADKSIWQRMAWRTQSPATPKMGPSTTPPVRIAETPAPRKIKHPEKLNLAYGRWQEQMGQLSEARRSYDNVLKDDPKAVDAILGLARLDQLAGRTQAAEAGFERAVKMKPRDPRVLGSLGQFYASQERWPDAIRSFEEALAGDASDLTKSENAAIECHLALAQAGSGDIPGAMPHFANSVGEAAGHFHVGQILCKQGQSAAAEQHFAQALRLRPDLREAQVLLDKIRTARPEMQLASDEQNSSPAAHNAVMAAPHRFQGSLQQPSQGIARMSKPPSGGNLNPAGFSEPAGPTNMSPQQQEQWRNQFSGGVTNP